VIKNKINIGRSANSVNPAVSSSSTITSYYSGTDARIYFGDIWVDEIVEIEFGLQEQVAPIYGYGSYTWDVVARGNRVVAGQFVINFKEVGYLQTILNSLSSAMNTREEDKWFSLNEFNKEIGEGTGRYKRDLPPETVIENFKELANDYEATLWGEPGSDRKEFNEFTDNRTKEHYFSGTRFGVENNKLLKNHGFNILLTYGGACDPGRVSTGYRTTQTIVGVQLTGVSQRVDPSGNPIQEVYSFIAKDLSGNVTNGY